MHTKKTVPILVAVLVAFLYMGHLFIIHAESTASLFSLQDTYLLAKNTNGNNGGGNGGNNGGGNGGGGNNGNNGGGGNNGNNGGGNGGGGNNGNNGGGNSGGGNNSNYGRGNNSGNGNNGGEGGGQAGIQGRGLASHAAALHFTLKMHGLHQHSMYDYTMHHENIHPSSFADSTTAEIWSMQEHMVLCSMFKYLKRMKEERPRIRPGYVDWLIDQTANAIGEEPAETKAALLGYPHDHPHTSTTLRTISEEGCASHTHIPATHNELFAEEHALEDPTEQTERFTVEQTSTDSDIGFRVVDSGTVFQNYGISHTKEMHLIVVRDDLQHFYHIHPTRDADGTWHVPFTAPAGGTYRMYADFVDQEIHHHTLRFDRRYPGDPGPTGLDKNVQTEKTVGDYRVTLETTPYSQGTLFTYHIRDEDGNAPFLEPYLGAMGHGILLSPNGDFIHTHPSPAGDYLTFHIGAVKEDFYRIFAQFQVKGQVFTTEFDWEPHRSMR